MQTLWSMLHEVARNPKLASGLRAIVVLVTSLLLARLASSGASAALGRASAQHRMLGRRVAFYSVLALGVVSTLDELGFSVHTLLGAAGLATVALGLAAQTSTSNFIAGLFLIAERPFVIGDVVRIGSTTGEVLSIDLLSIKLRTYDNLYVRVPNESVVKTEVANLTHFPIRRVDLAIGVAFATDLKRARAVLLEVAHRHPLCLEEPKPTLMIQGFGESAIQLQFSLWVARQHFFELKSSIHERIKEAFERERIELPFPQCSVGLSMGGGEPLAVTLVQTADGAAGPRKA
jgi:small-conductance mechanosensitive channel